MAFSEAERYVPAPALARCRDACRELAMRLGSRAAQGSLRVVADFRLLGGDKVELVWASLPRSDDPIPVAHFPASMPCASLRRPSDGPPERPTFESTGGPPAAPSAVADGAVP
eukprot:4892519-Prymnesium_polylepis.1